MFVEVIDPITGQQIWKVADENYDLAQEIARSAFGDMIHDSERNRKFELGLKSVISELKKKNENVHVIDIGTGTGLLSMMAARAGADRVTALEVFKPMADCAKKIFRENGYEKRIHLIPSRSTDILDVSPSERGNVIVAEVFDTELIGEGALRTFKEAHRTLVKHGCRVVPSTARVWITPVQSDFLMCFHRPPSKNLKPPEFCKQCPGAAAVHDIQLSEVPRRKIHLLGEPLVAFSFDFENGPSINYDETIVRTFEAQSDGTFEAILLWWDLDMDGTGKYMLSTAPIWWDREATWRDHWMQAVYYLPESIQVRRGERITVRCSHDEFSFWFAVHQKESQINEPNYCRCKMHTVCSRNAIYRLNKHDRGRNFQEFLKQKFAGKSVICVGDGSLMGLMLAKYAKTVRIVEPNPHFLDILLAYANANGIQNVCICRDVDSISCDEDDVIASEPFYLSSLLPWHNLCFWFTAHRLLTKWKSKHLRISPKEGILYALPVKFDYLWKVAASVGIVEGFDLTAFDNLCQKARTAVDAIVEPQPLWEYPSIVTGEPTVVARFDFSTPPSASAFTAKITLSASGTNAIVFWMDWLHDGYRLTSGLRAHARVNQRPEWSVAHRQGVYFIPRTRLKHSFELNLLNRRKKKKEQEGEAKRQAALIAAAVGALGVAQGTQQAPAAGAAEAKKSSSSNIEMVTVDGEQGAQSEMVDAPGAPTPPNPSPLGGGTETAGAGNAPSLETAGQLSPRKQKSKSGLFC